MDVVTRAEGDTAMEAHRPELPNDAAAADATLYQDVVFLYRLVPGTSAYATTLFHAVSRHSTTEPQPFLRHCQIICPSCGKVFRLPSSNVP